jgi:hypothetical protein
MASKSSLLVVLDLSLHYSFIDFSVNRFKMLNFLIILYYSFFKYNNTRIITYCSHFIILLESFNIWEKLSKKKYFYCLGNLQNSFPINKIVLTWLPSTKDLKSHAMLSLLTNEVHKWRILTWYDYFLSV